MSTVAVRWARAVRGRVGVRLRDLWPLVLICAVGSAGNLVWIAQHRRGLPFDIDEAGYLERALIDGRALDRGGITGFFSHLHSPDPQAPLLPATAGVVRSVLGVGPVGMMGVQEVFYVALIASTWYVSRRLAGRGFAIVMAIVAGALPGVLYVARTFQFALVAAGAVAVALAVLVACRDFDSWRRSAAWGVTLGVAALSRTMVLGLIPGLLLAGGLRVVVAGPTWRRVMRFALAVVVGFAVAASWYSASWRNVLHYLRDYGYGAQAASYGPAHAPLSLGWWTARAYSLAAASSYFLVVAAVALSVGATIGARVADRWDREAARSADSAPPRRARVRNALASDTATVSIVGGYGYVALSSTRNIGSSFELPIAMPLIVATIVWAWRRTTARSIAAAALVTVSVFGFIQSLGVLPLHYRTVKLGSKTVPLYDDRGNLGDTARRTARLASASDHDVDQTLRAYQAAVDRAARAIDARTRQAGVSPVILFAVQDPWFNTNTVPLTVLLLSGREAPVGLFLPAPATPDDAMSLLEDPAHGQPNVVITGPPDADPYASNFAVLRDPMTVEDGLRRDGFAVLAQVTEPDGRTMRLWFKDRGPVLR